MSPWLAAILGADPQPVPVPFTSNGTFTTPFGVSKVDLSGKGAAGSPANPGTVVLSTFVQYTFTRRDGGGVDFQSSTVSGHPYGDASYCDPSAPFTPEENATYSSYQACYYPQTDIVGNSPATTGASTTGFGKTFPGGLGGAANTTTFNSVTVTENTSYPIVVPTGGSLTITYYQ